MKSLDFAHINTYHAANHGAFGVQTFTVRSDQANQRELLHKKDVSVRLLDHDCGCKHDAQSAEYHVSSSYRLNTIAHVLVVYSVYV
jgi:hypothetical protein